MRLPSHFQIYFFSTILVLTGCNNPQEAGTPGCTDPEACNYNSEANEDDNSCLYADCFGDCGGDAIVDCTGICGGAYRQDDCGECLHPENQASQWNSSCSGCTDENAANYDNAAIIDDGSCIDDYPDGWELIWNDEFNSEFINQNNWTQENRPSYFVNNELQAYTDRPQNSYIENGHLVIRAIRENYNGAEYTSARLVTAGKADWMYGRYDIRAKVPLGQGTWPAIWMLGTNISLVGWPDCGEIDIMEHVNNTDTIHGSVHSSACFSAIPGYPGVCPDYNMSCPDGCQDALPNSFWTSLDQIDDWHVFSLEWTENSLTFSIDTQPFMTLNRPINSDEQSWPFDQNFYMILNLAIGGTWPGDPDNSIFPVTFEIDYVRIYQPE